MVPEWKDTSSFSIKKLKAQINVASTACALLPDSCINFLHVHNKSCITGQFSRHFRTEQLKCSARADEMSRRVSGSRDLG